MIAKVVAAGRRHSPLIQHAMVKGLPWPMAQLTIGLQPCGSCATHILVYNICLSGEPALCRHAAVQLASRTAQSHSEPHRIYTCACDYLRTATNCWGLERRHFLCVQTEQRQAIDSFGQVCTVSHECLVCVSGLGPLFIVTH
jgi:hypothetical protein